jgi:hypothetical protein
MDILNQVEVLLCLRACWLKQWSRSIELGPVFEVESILCVIEIVRDGVLFIDVGECGEESWVSWERLDEIFCWLEAILDPSQRWISWVSSDCVPKIPRSWQHVVGESETKWQVATLEQDSKRVGIGPTRCPETPALFFGDPHDCSRNKVSRGSGVRNDSRRCRWKAEMEWLSLSILVSLYHDTRTMTKVDAKRWMMAIKGGFNWVTIVAKTSHSEKTLNCSIGKILVIMGRGCRLTQGEFFNLRSNNLPQWIGWA